MPTNDNDRILDIPGAERYRENPQALFTVSETARALNLSPRQVRTLIKEGRLEGIRVNSRVWRVTPASIYRFTLQQTEVGTKDERR